MVIGFYKCPVSEVSSLVYGQGTVHYIADIMEDSYFYIADESTDIPSGTFESVVLTEEQEITLRDKCRDPLARKFIPNKEPDIQSFKSAIFQDQNMPILSKMELLKYFPLVEQYANQPLLMQEAWLGVKFAYSSSWLSSTVVDAVETYAEQFNIPLV